MSVAHTFQRYVPQTTAAQRGMVARDRAGNPEGLALYGRDNGNLEEFHIDLEGTYMNDPLRGKYFRLAGLRILCPRCGGPLYIPGPDMPRGRDMEVLWSKGQECSDGLIRYPVSVDRPFGCDYGREGNVVTGETAGDGGIGGEGRGVLARCGWWGGIHEGRLRDHQIVRGVL